MESDFQNEELENIESPLASDNEGSNPIPFAYSNDWNKQPTLAEAKTVYLLLPKNIPISRCTRLQWLLDHLNTVITVTNSDVWNNPCNDMQVIAVHSGAKTNEKCNRFLVTDKTQVKFIAHSYRFVYCLDMSPSHSAINIQKDLILFDELLSHFRTSLEGLCMEFTLPIYNFVFQPNIYLTVIVNTPFYMSPAQQVLIKGVQVNLQNCKEIVEMVQSQFYHIEGRIAQVSAMAHDNAEIQQSQHEGIVGGLFDLPENEQFIADIPMVTPDANFVNMLRYSMLAISLLPENSLSHILVITDGVVAMPDSNITESLLYQLHYDSISVSFLKVGCSFHPHSSAGYVSYINLLQFISKSTLGSCMEEVPNIKYNPSTFTNIYHENYLIWSFHSEYIHSGQFHDKHKWILSCDSFQVDKTPNLLFKKQAEENINASVILLLSRRMREGYTIDSISYVNNLLEIHLSLQWKAFIYIHYKVTSQWPAAKNLTHFEVSISAPYEFLYDITYLTKKEAKSTYRQSIIERFWVRLTHLTSGDTALAQQFNLFQNTNTWYTLPESVRSGIPVFILNGSIIHDNCKLNLSPSDLSCPKFVNMWQLLCQMEITNWRRWFHTHKLSLILKHDHPLPKHLHLANSSGRFQVVQCRQAATALYGLLSDWASFVLIDNHTYLKLLYREHDKPPTWFCIIRISSKLPCSILNIGFITGTPGHLRQEICEELKFELASLMYMSSPVKSKEHICCTLLHKPLEKILIRYERIPNDFSTVIFPDGTQPPITLQRPPASPFAGTLFTTLSRYLYHKRWIWSTTYLPNPKLGFNAIARVLNTLTRMRIKEGFSFAHSSSGIITMVLELQMDSSSKCIVQYVLFPPHSAWWGEKDMYSGSEDDIEPESDFDVELQMVTEVWIEPQYGNIKTGNSRLAYMHGKPYNELADAIKEIDQQCINSLLTLEHISLMCQDKAPLDHKNHRTSFSSRADRSSISKNSRNSSNVHSPIFSNESSESYLLSSPRIQHIPFEFDPINILPLCQQTELLFSMFIEEEKLSETVNQDLEKTNDLLLNSIEEHLQCIHNQELILTREESDRFTQQIVLRHKNKHPNLCPISETFPNKSKSCNSDEELTSSQWHCFIRGISITHIIMTFIPATLKDLKGLVVNNNCSGSSLNESIDSSTNVSSLSESNYSDVPINKVNSLPLPIYVFDCHLGMLVDSYINNLKNTSWANKNIYEDHRYKYGSVLEEDCIRLKSGDFFNRSPEPKNEDSESNEHRSIARNHCKTIILIHSKCFTTSLFSALHDNTCVHTLDVQSAMDQCEENVYEIDISEYLFTVCGHLKHHAEDHIKVSYLNQYLSCNELKSLHHLIKEKFFKIVNITFHPIPTNKEFYYCRNLSYSKGDNKEEDSDDEISTAQSEIIKFKTESAIVLDNFGTDNQNSDTVNDISPLFLHLICTVHYNNHLANCSVKVIPTCLGELMQHIECDTQSLEKAKLQITLDILCLTLPTDVQNVIVDYSTKNLRTTSFSSDGFQPSIASSSEASYNSDFKETEPLIYLPEIQRRAIVMLRDEIKWLLKDEIATALLDVNPITVNTLNFVIQHVSESESNTSPRLSCLLDTINLNFVYDNSQSLEKFLQEFSKITIPKYKLCKLGDLYYLAKDKSKIEEEIDAPESLNEPNDFTIEKEIHMDAVSDVNAINDENDFHQSDISSLGGSTGTFGGYDEDISDDENDYDWLNSLDNKREHLPNFWLIMKFDQNAVIIYFHCRFLELPTTLVGIYLEVQRAMRDAIRDLCKHVNQSLLLQSLYETRTCNYLLEPDDNYKSNMANVNTSSFVRLKSMDETSDEFDNFATMQEVSLNFKAGEFSCPVVWQTHFVLHPRLKTGPGKSGISRGILALKNILDKFSVSNRNNMFVYRDNNSNVFYLRLHENVQNSCNKMSMIKSNEFENPTVSRSPSIASLPLGQNKNSLTRSEHSISSAASSEIRPRVRSFGEKESKDGPSDDTLILKVHGITEAGQDVRCELVQVLQNRLDDAVLEFLSITLARNAMCPLTPEDVHFLQKPFRLPEVVIRLSIQEFALKFLDSFIYYLQQNLLQFLNIPKYTDSRSHYHFKDYSETDQNDSKVNDENIYIYNQSQNPSSGSRGIACIALAIINHCEKNTDQHNIGCDNLYKNKMFEKIVYSTIIEDTDKLPNKYIEFRIWKQGRVNIDNLIQKLKTATSQATWDIVMEYYLLQAPLCEKFDDHDLSTTADSKLISPKEISSDPKESECVVLFDTNFTDNINVAHNYTSVKLSYPTKRQLHKKNMSEIIKNNIKFNCYELGDDGVLSENYSLNLQDWLEFGVNLLAPAIRKHKLTLTNRHLPNVAIREMQNLIMQLSQEQAKAFKSLIVDCDEVYVPYVQTNSPQKFILISRNFEQWKTYTCRDLIVGSDLINNNSLKHMQKFTPCFTSGNVFVPRQKFFWATVESDHITFYTYNWSKDNVDKLIDCSTHVGLWLSVRASFLNSVTAQKLGLFCNQSVARKTLLSSNNPYIGIVGDKNGMKKFSKDYGRHISSSGFNSLPISILDAFRDTYKHIREKSQDPVRAFTLELQELKHIDKEHKDELKKLHSMYQSRTSTCTYQQIQIFIQNSRIIHFCHTPILFLPKWRLQSAATRDHSLSPAQVNEMSSNASQFLPTVSDESWFKRLCYGFVSEYKHYLQTLGFMPLQIENPKKHIVLNKNESVSMQSVYYIQKAILGGILMFSVQFNKPFFVTKLYAIECSRLQSTNSRASINRFTLSFLDECDRIKVLMHLHSFTYDFHLRCIYNYVSITPEINRVCDQYDMINFLDDFMKYYNKAPNFARNLIYAETITITDLLTEGKELYDYLLAHVHQFNFEVYSMLKQDGKRECVLVQVTNTPQMFYKDSQDRQHTDDFFVTLIISNVCAPYAPWNNVLHLKYYLILTSRREIYPKSEVEHKLGKFRTVSSLGRSVSISGPEKTYNSVESNSLLKSQTKDSDHESNNSYDVFVNDESKKSKDDEKPTGYIDIKIQQEAVNYLGYYSSHEQLMQQLILDCANATQNQIKDMVSQGMVHCRTHLLWNKLISSQESNSLTYAEFIELKSLAKLEHLCDVHPNLSSLLNQPLTWYQGLAKLLLVKYNDQNRLYISPDGNIQHYVVLHPRYIGAFMLLSMDLHTSRGDLYAVYREAQKYEVSDMCIADRKALLDGFINCVCFYLWTGMI